MCFVDDTLTLLLRRDDAWGNHDSVGLKNVAAKASRVRDAAIKINRKKRCTRSGGTAIGLGTKWHIDEKKTLRTIF